MGKSYLIQTLAKWVDYILRSKDDNPDMPKVLLLAFTGVAASIIGNYSPIILTSKNRILITIATLI